MPEAPLADDRRQFLDEVVRKQHYRADALITVLSQAQESFGHLDLATLRYVARSLRLPPSRVYGVATFYHLFRVTPTGEHTCVLCRGTACFVHGAEGLVRTAEQRAGVEVGQTTADGRLSLAEARCVGACGLAPVAVLDDRTVGHVAPGQLAARLQEWTHGS